MASRVGRALRNRSAGAGGQLMGNWIFRGVGLIRKFVADGGDARPGSTAGGRLNAGPRGKIRLGAAMQNFGRILVAIGLMGWAALVTAHAADGGRVQALKITVLSTMLADGDELGEWGFAALVEADGHRILFDTGAKTDVVLRNARSLGVDLSTVPDVILSHSHWDHTGGFMTLRKSVMEKTPAALARTHIRTAHTRSASRSRSHAHHARSTLQPSLPGVWGTLARSARLRGRLTTGRWSRWGGQTGRS